MFLGRGRFLRTILLAVSLLATASCYDQQETRLQKSVRTDHASPPIKHPPAALLATQEAFMEIALKTTPSVVNIRAAKTVSRPDIDSIFEDFFEDFFGQRPRSPQKEQSLGSGFILTGDGYILTNEHVVKGAEDIKVKLSDQRIYDGNVVGSDPKTDVAVLKIEAEEELPAVVLGDSDALQAGQWALAIGNPFGLDRTLTVGIVSATGRTDVGIEDFEDFIQTDASINPGNSGGPLLNIYGEVIGVNTAIVAGGQGIGFAIPVNLAKNVAKQLIETGEASHGWLGVRIQEMTSELAESFGLDRVTGALVTEVLSASPAEVAGIHRGDILLALDGKEIRTPRTLRALVAGLSKGESVDFEILREGRRIHLLATIGGQGEETAARSKGSGTPLEGRGLGLTVEPDPEKRGLFVTGVDPQSPAAAAGVLKGDLILSINRRPVKDLPSFRQALEMTRPRKNVVLLIAREESTLYLAFPAP